MRIYADYKELLDAVARLGALRRNGIATCSDMCPFGRVCVGSCGDTVYKLSYGALDDLKGGDDDDARGRRD